MKGLLFTSTALIAFYLNYKKYPLEAGGLVLAYFALILPIQQFLNQREVEEKDRRFNNYHTMISKLSGMPTQEVETYHVEKETNKKIIEKIEEQTTVMKLDMQIAVVFELRNYKEYHEVTARILEGLLRRYDNEPRLMKLIAEIHLTLNYINDKKNKFYLSGRKF